MNRTYKMMRRVAGVLALALLVANQAHPIQVNTSNQEEIGSYGGKGKAVAALGNTVYFHEGRHLVVLDVTNRQAPREIRRIKSAHEISEMRVSGNVLVAYGPDGFQFYSIQTPASPVLKRFLAGAYKTWDLQENFIYAATGKNFTIIDLSDSANPKIRSTTQPLPALQTSIRDLAVNSGKIALTSSSDKGTTQCLSIIDVSNPDKPQRVGARQYHSSLDYFSFRGLAMANGLIYSTGNRTINCFDVSDPISINLIGQAQIVRYGFDWNRLILNNQTAYLIDVDWAGPWGGIQVIDISNPANPVNEGSLDFLDEAVVGADFKKPWLYSSTTQGLKILDASDPLSPTLKGTFSSLGRASGVALAAGRAYVLSDRLTVMNISDLTNPTPVASVIIAGIFGQLRANGSRLYNLNSDSGLSIIDLTSRDAPVLKGRVKTPGQPYDFAIEGNYAYVADGSSMQVIDVSNPQSPKLLTLSGGNPKPFRNFTGIAVRNGRAYLADAIYGMKIYDVSKPTVPKLLGIYSSYDNDGWSVVVDGNVAILGGSGGFMETLDVSDPSKIRRLNMRPDNPQKIASDAIGGTWATSCLYAYNSQIYHVIRMSAVAPSQSYMLVFDNHLPEILRGIASFHLQTGSYIIRDLAFSGRYEFIAQNDDGFLIVRATNPYNRVGVGWQRYE